MSNIQKAREEANNLPQRKEDYNSAIEKANKTLEEWKTAVKKN
jgi:septation ring formation regulator EzrA